MSEGFPQALAIEQELPEAVASADLVAFDETTALAEVEQPGLLSRMGEFARDHMPNVPRPPRKLVAGVAVAAIAIGGAFELGSRDTSTAEAAPVAAKQSGTHMKPTKVMTSLRGILRNEYNDTGIGSMPTMNLKKTVALNGGIELDGKCKPGSPNKPSFSAVSDIKDDLMSVPCDKKQRTSHYYHTDISYENGINRVGDKMVASANLADEEHGDVARIVATKSKASVIFENSDSLSTSGTGQRLKKLVFNKQGRVVKKKLF